MTTYTNDSTGEKYETVEDATDTDWRLIRPIKVEPKWMVHNNGRYLEIHFDNFEDQAQLITEWISAGMRAMNDTEHWAYEDGRFNRVIGKLELARNALQKGQDD